MVLAGAALSLTLSISTLAGASDAPASSQKTVAASKPRLSAEAQLEQWSRALKGKNPSAAYASLSVFASRRGSGELGQRAALALGYYDYSKGNYVKARTWLTKAAGDNLLGDYVLYWGASTDRSLNHFPESLDELKQLRAKYPDSVMTEQALETMGEVAIAASKPQEALDALAAYGDIETKPQLLFVRAQVRENANMLDAAAADYIAVHYGFPTSLSAHEAGEKADLLRSKMGANFPVVSLDMRMARADTLYATHEWYQAREEYIGLMPSLTGAALERAQVRIAQCRVALGAPISALTELTVTDPEADAERLYNLTQAYRNQQSETPMLASVDAAVNRAAASPWAEQALFAAGNYFWVQLDRDRAVQYYGRIDREFAGSADAPAASWRVAWTAYLENKPEALSLLEQYLERYPISLFITDDLYWLGREAEKAGDTPRARAYFLELHNRFPQTYFGVLSTARIVTLGAGPVATVQAFDRIPPTPPAMPLSKSIPDAAAPRQARADALRSIAFDSSAELELRAAFAATGEPRLLLEAAKSAADAGHYAVAMGIARQIYPGLEGRQVGDVSPEIWKTAYPLPYEKELRAAAAHAGVDPMLVAGLIRQESAFDKNAVSHANAYGLMQILPKTARLLARHERIGYSRTRLTDPEYNLRLGTVYLASLEKNWGSFEAALAAYNAGEDHVATWRSGHQFSEPAEFVDSIPFTETREYVRIVLRNADMYRRLYGGSASEASAAIHQASRRGAGNALAGSPRSGDHQ